MRIAFVLHQFFPRHHTGTEQYARALAHEARRRGHEIVIFTFEPEYARAAPARVVADDVWEGIPIRRAATARGLAANPVLEEYDSPLMTAIFSKFLDEFRPEKLHFFHLLSVGAGALREALGREIDTIVHATDFFSICPIATLTLPDGTPCEGPPDSGFGCFSCIHGGVEKLLQKEKLKKPLRDIYQYSGAIHSHRPLVGAMSLGLVGRKEFLISQISKAGAVAAPSKFLYNSLVKAGVPEGKLKFIPYGLDLDRFVNLKERPDGAPVVFGYFGTIAPHKGLLTFAEAFIKTAKTNANIQMLVRGRLGEFPEYGEKVFNLLKNDPRAEIAPPFAPSELGEALSAIDVLVVPSLWHENTPFVALEAVAARRPVLASDRGGLAEMVGRGRGGALFPAGDIEALSGLLVEFSHRDAIAAASRGAAPPRSIANAWDDLAAC